ncbi:hypothetical protein BRADI_2g15800v3 [Brachypodium distachyon]|uniref:Transcription factor CBF/NF-Y/archaeal histone domain-containing protein n=1 Tax=Brachypodium distachyon TaxID=15368 RepID=A0A0Q3FZH3_BRADI|nr:hypothetical protein BRADI_2g15800v3 [Brachypodium distachyon]
MSDAVGTPEEGGGGAGAREQERFLPIANIGRIMRRGVPENGKIAKDAKESIQECVSEFISFITSEASDKCMKEKRKTINGDDLIWSMGTLGFEDYVEPLKLYLKLYREVPLSSSPLCPLAKLLVLLPLTNFAPLGCSTHVL